MAKADIALLQRFDACVTADWKMLIAGLPHAAEEAPEKRHKFQRLLLDLMTAALQDSKERTAATQATTAVKLQDAAAELEARKARAREAVSSEELAAEALKGKIAARSAAHDEVKKGEEKLRPADAEKARVDKKLDVLKQERDKAAFVVEATLNLLRKGEWDESEAREESIDTLRKFLKEIKVEDALIASMPGVYHLKPGDRRAFDQVVEQAIEKATADHVAKLNELFEKEAGEAEEVKVEALGLWAMLDVAKDSVSAAEEEVASATASHCQVLSVRTEAEAAVVEQERLCKSLAADHQSQSDKLNLHVGAFEAVERLRNGDYAVAVDVDMSTDAIGLGADSVIVA